MEEDYNKENNVEIKTNSEEKPKKTGVWNKIIMAFLSVTTLALSGFLIYHYISFDHNPMVQKTDDGPVVQQKEETTEEKDENGNTITSTTISSTIVSSDATDLVVKSVIADIETTIDEKSSIKLARTYAFARTYDEFTPLIKLVEAKVPLKALKSYNLLSTSDTLNNDMETGKILREIIIERLAELGFSRNEEIEANIATGGAHFVNDQTGITCLVSSGLPVYIGCSHKSWIPADSVKIANQLAEAYYKKEGEYPLSIDTESYTIKDSLVSPYQMLYTSVSNGYGTGLFYRVNKDAEWEYFNVTLTGLDCEEYDTKDVRNAFAGEKCWDSSTDSGSKVKAWEE
jgi:cell division protein FtsL